MTITLAKYHPVNVVVNINNVRPLTRHLIVDWVNEQLSTKLNEIEDLCSGAAYCQLLDVLFKGSISLKRVIFRTNIKYDYMQNLKLLRLAMQRLGVRCVVPINRLVRGRFLANFKFAQWFKLFFDANYTWREYDPVAARFGLPLGIGPVIKIETYKARRLRKLRSCRSMSDLTKGFKKRNTKNKNTKADPNPKPVAKPGNRAYSMRVLRSLNTSHSEVDSETLSDIEKRQEALKISMNLLREVNTSKTEYIEDIEPPPELFMSTPQSSVNDEAPKVATKQRAKVVSPVLKKTKNPSQSVSSKPVVAKVVPKKAKQPDRVCSFITGASKEPKVKEPTKRNQTFSGNILKRNQTDNKKKVEQSPRAKKTDKGNTTAKLEQSQNQRTPKKQQCYMLKCDQTLNNKILNNNILKEEQGMAFTHPAMLKDTPEPEEHTNKSAVDKGLKSQRKCKKQPTELKENPTTIIRSHAAETNPPKPEGYASGYKYRVHKDIVEVVVNNLHTKHELLQTIDFTDSNHDMMRVKLLGVHLLCESEQANTLQGDGKEKKQKRLTGGGEKVAKESNGVVDGGKGLNAATSITLFYESVKCADVGTQYERYPLPIKNKPCQQKRLCCEGTKKAAETVKTAKTAKNISKPATITRTEKKVSKITPKATPNATRTVNPVSTPNATRTANPVSTPNATRTVNPVSTPNATRTVTPVHTPNATRTVTPATSPNATRINLPNCGVSTINNRWVANQVLSKF